MEKLNKFLIAASKRQDLVFAVFFVAIVAMLIFPLPHLLVDALLALNLTISLMILITSIYLTSPLGLSTFPTIILITAIFRVSLSVATTRLILAYGDAGELIMAFGQFVIGGNLVVGLVVFFIIAIVNFMVITKGAERISEVGARFTLDAMPGKQMAIDNDLRSGDIDKHEAKRRRKNLEMEMTFHGAMDGAMRFVKGDAIASLIILVVNMLGGLTIGILQRGMPAGEAGRLYTLLSVGDGLIAQIPAIFISIAAGVIVTRVSADEETDIGAEISGQLFAEPRAVAVSGVFAILMGLIPGFPMLVFFTLGGLLCWFAYKRTRGRKRSDEGGGHAGGGTADPGGQAESAEPVTLRASEPTDSMAVVAHPDFLAKLNADVVYQYITQSREQFAIMAGYSPPPSGFRPDPRLPYGTTVVEIDRVPVSRFAIEVGDPSEPLTEDQGWEYGQKLFNVRMANAHRLFGVPEATEWLQAAQASSGRLATDIQQLIPLMTLIEVMRRLLEDGIGLTPPRLILEGLVQASQRSQDPDTLVEIVRGFLRRQISHMNSADGRIIDALVIAPDVDNSLRQIAGFDSGPNEIRASDELTQRFVSNAKAMIDAETAAGRKIVVLTTADTRRTAKRVLKQASIEVPVLSYSDVAQGFEVRTVAVLSAEAREAA